MIDPHDHAALEHAYRHSIDYLEQLASRHVAGIADADRIAARMPAALPTKGIAAEEAIDELTRTFDDGITASTGGRFFGWVTGGSYPAGVAADWLTSTWDQLAGPGPASPAADAADRVVGRWLTELLGLPSNAATGLVTGTQMANFCGLAAGRHAQMERFGWDVSRRGLHAAPPITVVAGAERHVTIDTALRYLGIGTDAIAVVDTDAQGRILPDAFRAALDRTSGPAIVCLSAGNVHTGSFDDFRELVPAARRHRAWVHVDGAFGMWAACAPAMAHLTAGIGDADSWGLDAHKWLNVPYDSAAVIVRDPRSLVAAMSSHADYLTFDDDLIDPLAKVPEMSRRARGFAFLTTMRHLGREGIADLVTRCCRLATAFAEELSSTADVTVLNDVVLNQVLIAIEGADPPAVAARVCLSGTAFVTPSVWQGRPVLRISVSGWRTDDNDVALTVEAIRRAIEAVRRTD